MVNRIFVNNNRGLGHRAMTAILLIVVFAAATIAMAQQTRVLGLDVSTYQGSLEETNWATIKRATNQVVDGVYGDGRDFVFIRASRGGTTGEDHRQGGYPAGDTTYFTLSQRYDDPYFVQNITRATAAGLLAGPYHFARPDVLASTTNTGGIANSGTDEANHLIQMAGAWMRPGYLLPVFDLEAGNPQRTANQLAAFCKEFSDRIYQVMGIRPIMYINGSYSTYLQSSTNPASLVVAYPKVWDARYAINDNPSSTAYWTGHPKDTFSGFYGPWDDPPNPTHPWSFWQYASSAGRLNGYKNGTTAIDLDVAQGGMELLRDHLVPALWMNDSDGDWTTLSNWNSGTTPVAPIQSSGQLTPVGTLVLPVERLPGSNDTVVLDRPNANITIALSSGVQNIRKLYARETLNLTGGALNIGYVPSWDSTSMSAQFTGPVTLSSNASMSVHTLQIDATNVFTLNGGAIAFNSIRLMPGVVPARLTLAADAEFTAFNGSIVKITNGTGTGSVGFVDLSAGTRTCNVPANTVLSVEVPVANGGLTKGGPGTLELRSTNLYAGNTTINEGTLIVNNTTGSGTGSGNVIVENGILRGNGAIAGEVSVHSGGTIAAGIASATGRLTLATPPALNGTTSLRIDWSEGNPFVDQIALTSGTLTYGGTLVITNIGARLLGGEVFTNFLAAGYAGAFSSVVLPPLDPDLNWYLGDLNSNGSIRVNRSPVANAVTFTNIPGVPLHIPILSLDGWDDDNDAIVMTGVSAASTNGVPLVTTDGFVVYSNNVNVADRFSYALTDGRGGTATGLVFIAPLNEAQFIKAPTVATNTLTLHFAGVPGATYFIERSTNLTSWATISTNVMPATGVFDLDESFSDSSLSVYYRLRW